MSLIHAGKVNGWQHPQGWLTEQVDSGHENMSRYQVTQPDGAVRVVLMTQVTATVLPEWSSSPAEALEEMAKHLKWVRDHQYSRSYIVTDGQPVSAA